MYWVSWYEPTSRQVSTLPPVSSTPPISIYCLRSDPSPSSLMPVTRRYLTFGHFALSAVHSMPGQLSTTSRVMLSVPSSVRSAACSFGRYCRSSVCNVAGRTALTSGEPLAKVTPVSDVSDASKVSNLVLWVRSMPVSCVLFRPPMLSDRRFLQPSTNRLLSVVCVPAQLISSVVSAVRLLRLSVCRIA